MNVSHCFPLVREPQALTALTLSLPELSASGHVVALSAMTVLGQTMIPPDGNSGDHRPEENNRESRDATPAAGTSVGGFENDTGATSGSGSRSGSAEGRPVGGRSGSSSTAAAVVIEQFIDRVLRSAFERRSEFSAVELSWLVEGCLPGLDNVVLAGRSDNEGHASEAGRSDDKGSGGSRSTRSKSQGVDTYEVPSGLAVGLARELAQRQARTTASGGGEQNGDMAEPVAAVLAGYVSASLLERSNGVL